jgi:hypothetical protein
VKWLHLDLQPQLKLPALVLRLTTPQMNLPLILLVKVHVHHHHDALV